MIPEWLKTVKWDDPAIFGPMVAAITAGIFALVNTILKRKKTTDTTPANVNKNENNQSIVFSPTTGLDAEDVGKHVGKAVEQHVDPLKETVDSHTSKFAALERGQQEMKDLLQAQLAPKQEVPESGDPLKIMAIEFFNDGIDAYNEGDKGQAIGHWLDALKLDPNGSNTHYNLAVALWDKDDMDGVIEHLNTGVRINPDDADAHNNLGVALSAKGDLEGAIEHYNAALKIDPDNASTHYNLGLALKKAKGDLDGAMEHWKEALRIDPDNAKYHNGLGCVLALKKGVVGAVSALTRAIELDDRYRNWAKTDTDYDAIRGDPVFRKLVYGEDAPTAGDGQ